MPPSPRVVASGLQASASFCSALDAEERGADPRCFQGQRGAAGLQKSWGDASALQRPAQAWCCRERSPAPLGPGRGDAGTGPGRAGQVQGLIETRRLPGRAGATRGWLRGAGPGGRCPRGLGWAARGCGLMRCSPRTPGPSPPARGCGMEPGGRGAGARGTPGRAGCGSEPPPGASPAPPPPPPARTLLPPR